MDTKIALDENLFVSSLSVQVSEYDTVHRFEIKKRETYNSFGLILEGEGSFFTLSERIDVKAGDFIFVPEGLQYSYCWTGKPKIRFVSVHFRMLESVSPVFHSVRIRQIENVGEDVRGCFDRMMWAQTQQDADGMEAMADFYALCAKVYPRIEDSCKVNIPFALQGAIEYIHENYRTLSRVSEISRACYLSESHLYHMFQEYLGTSPVAYLNSLRVQKAMEPLVTTDKTIENIAEENGFHSGYYFRKIFKSVTGVLPSEYRRYS